ncbi:MAG: acyl-CoA dehydrogenase [Naasia sp.]|jgi:alkylation response protein AidB-like acyl-CoA dehydrogenase|uniref:acyl-CoA dehydrogenase family protein n=1 Tax=Naasia sp. TaxID=2546198 RepID=UPI00261AF881|nr:acyl-CoA dehydrogenase family protein [Naasia sp.]MCU1570753.1 acyl-CoA dehydrogenase [Naasia sp.]
MADRTVLDEALLERIAARAPEYDRGNRFFTEDLEELTAAGYLRAMVPAEFGGLGLTLRETAREQQRLAAAAPATALGVNMHLVWTGVAKVVHDRGLDFLDFLLEEAGAGEVLGFGISEAGNDLVLFGSRTEAVPQEDGGYRFTGTKVFTSLSPAWTRLGLFGLDTVSADAPKLVHAFIDREAAGYRILDDWDTLGQRATQSSTTVLDGVYAPPERVFRRLDPGPNPDPLIFGIFANFEVLLASVYTGIGARALELATASAHRRTSMRNGGAPLAHDPDIRWRIADAALAQDALAPQIDAIARDVDELADHGAQWFRKLVGVKVRATETARVVVDAAIRVSGGSSYANSSELSRLYRDVLAGMFHPSDDESAHSTVATALLGPLP